MKVNKWTAGLAALGLVSLASVAQAEEKAANMVQTALSATTLSGYVDTSAQWNLGTGNNALPPYKFGGASKADGFNLNVVQIRIEKPLDEAEWAAGYRVDLWAGPDANVLNTQSVLTGANSDFALRQAYVALRMPVGNGIDWKVGVFDSIIGYESVEGPNNPNYTRSYGHSIEPQTHTGILASYRFCDMFSASFGVANTTGPTINNRANDPVASAFNPSASPKAESSKTWMGSIAVTAPDSMGFLAGSTLYAGIVSGFNESYGDNSTSYYIGSTLATPIQDLRLGASFDYLDVHGPDGVFRGGETWSVATYASYKATDKLSFHGRAEYLKDRGNQKFFTGGGSDPSLAALGDETLALTATAQYDLWKNVISRVELRWDHSLNDQRVFAGTGSGEEATGPTLDNAWMVALNIIYKF